MILSEIIDIIKQKGEVCETELYTMVDADRGLVNHAVEQLVRKKVIIEVNFETDCRGCSMKCSARNGKVYRMKDNL